MDRRSTLSLLRDYGVPMQDNTAYSLNYGKDSSKDPWNAKPKEPKVTKPGKNVKSKPWLKDHTGLLKIKEAKPMQDGGKITKFNPDQEKSFQSWYKRTSAKLGLDPNPDSPEHHYDYRGFYKENGDVPMTEGQHFTDTYKLPGHPTFSNESKYASFYNRDQQGYWAGMESGKGQDNFVKLAEKKLPIKAIGGILHNQGEKHPAKVKSVPLVCPNCGKEDCPGCLPDIPMKGDVSKNIKERFDYVHRTDPYVVAQLPKRLLYETPDGIKVFAVSDDFVKINMYDDFTEGGNWEAYPEFIPKGEVWVADDKDKENTKDIILHELTEVRLMQMKNMKYDKAHVIANRTEMNQRVKDNPGLLVRVPKEKKGGKVGNPENRDKPGGSNVGKYTKSQGPFAGPSGGAPAGSYPIGTEAHGRSALKLAHNAPNPGGIKAAVYRRFPDLKPKKAMEGAKLGIGGMGKMQDKAPIPDQPKHNYPPDKVKQNFALYKRKVKEPKKAYYGH